ncbi:MAG: ABC transporter substrate-binding protein [Alphaproteobacteria bacterium]
MLAAATAARAVTPDDVLVVGQIAEPRSLDPSAVTSLNDFRILVNMYDGLVRYRPGTLEVEPALAESWEIADDGMTYLFHLRPDVTFHDGTPFDADAVAFTFERMLDPGHPYHDTGPFPLSFFFSVVQDVDAVDPLTVAFHLRTPYAPLLSNLAYPTGLIVSPAAVKAYGADFASHPSGTGPFRFDRRTETGEIALVANPGYWDGPPALAGLLFRPIADAQARADALAAGTIDLMVEVPPDRIDAFDADPSFAVYRQTGPHLWFLILNLREPPFDDVRMRRAVNYAIDKQAIVSDVLRGTATVADGPIPPAFAWAHDPAVGPYAYDPAKARALIAEAGHGDGVEVRFLVTDGGSGMLDPVAMADAIGRDLAAVGITVVTETYDWNSYLGLVNPGLAGKGNMAEMAWMVNDPDTLPFLALRTEAFPAAGGFNSGYYTNPEVDRLLARARTTADQDTRAALYREVQRIVHEDAPWVFVANWQQNAVASARVQGLRLEPSFFLLLARVGKD